MFRFFSSDGPKPDEKAIDIEKYRACHRQLCQSQQPSVMCDMHAGTLNVEDERARKIPAKWCQKQRQQQQHTQVPMDNQLDVEVPMSFNAFDFSTSSEAFYETKQQQQQQIENKAPSSCQDNQQFSEEQQISERPSSKGSLWERRVFACDTNESIRQVPTLGQDALWESPMHYDTKDAQQQALYFQPQYYA
ncbi:unnamed protein product [Peronospora belbahrii]|uniref:Uncharacterized protein n=1 Tax=Peronospora belbahrii TaxID=622444 RepID=A0AAU9KVU8_9STRA|nr:unnamed protein product [Peronospora belbahrii]CAH0515955.1 unnamed protein product [Peronospora belbahrii]